MLTSTPMTMVDNRVPRIAYTPMLKKFEKKGPRLKEYPASKITWHQTTKERAEHGREIDEELTLRGK